MLLRSTGKEETMIEAEVGENPRKMRSSHPKSQRRSLNRAGQLPGGLVSSGPHPKLDPGSLLGLVFQDTGDRLAISFGEFCLRPSF